MLKRWGLPPRQVPRNLVTIRSPKSFERRSIQRKKAPKVNPELTWDLKQQSGVSAGSTTLTSPSQSVSLPLEASGTSLVSEAMPWLEEEDFMTSMPSPEKSIKPKDRWYLNCRDPKQWLPPLRAMSTLTYIPSQDMRLDTRSSQKLNKKGYAYLMFGIGKQRESLCVELDMKTFTWSNIIGKNNFGTPWSPGPRAGHVASYLGKGRIFIYGGEADPKTRRTSQKKIIGCPSSNREFVPGPVTMLAFDVTTSTWERFQPRISPGPRYLASLTKLIKRTGDHLLLFGGASVVVQKKKKPGAKQRRHAVKDIVDMTAAKDLHKTRTGRGSDLGEQPKAKTEVPTETFASEWRLKNDVWCLNTETMIWWLPKIDGQSPPPRMGHTATENATGSLFVIGGMRGIPRKKTAAAATSGKGSPQSSNSSTCSSSTTSNSSTEDFFTIWELVTTSSPMMWTRIQSRGENPSRRVLHTSVLSPWDSSTI
jgi:hypothetical protein